MKIAESLGLTEAPNADQALDRLNDELDKFGQSVRWAQSSGGLGRFTSQRDLKANAAAINKIADQINDLHDEFTDIVR